MEVEHDFSKTLIPELIFNFFFNLQTLPNFKTRKNSDMQANVHDLIKYTVSTYIYPILCKFKATFSYSFFAVPFLTILLDFVGFGRVARLYPSDFLRIEKNFETKRTLFLKLRRIF